MMRKTIPHTNPMTRETTMVTINDDKSLDFTKRLNIGCGGQPLPGYINLDRHPGPGVDFLFDLERCGNPLTHEQMEFPDNEFDLIVGSHILEHITNILPLMAELHRIAKPQAKAVFAVPYGSCDAADEDPTHVRRFFSRSFAYFSQAMYAVNSYGYSGDWITDRIVLKVDPAMIPPGATSDDAQQLILAARNVCHEMVVYMHADKTGRKAPCEDPTPKFHIRPIDPHRDIETDISRGALS